MVKPPTPKPSIIAFAEGNSALDVKLQRSTHEVVILQLELQIKLIAINDMDNSFSFYSSHAQLEQNFSFRIRNKVDKIIIEESSLLE